MNNKRHIFIRHKILAAILRPPVYLFFKLFFGYKRTKYRIENNKPYLILSNHIGGYDPILISLSFNRPIYYVASDHLFRISIISRILKYCFAPIPISKTMLDIKSIRHIRSVVSQNGCVGLFPSGNGSFNGEEAFISSSIGKLVKMLNIPVIIYNLEGLYFCTPRWSKQRRKGFSNGRIVKKISTQDIKNYSAEELSDIIINNLKTSAYNIQNSSMHTYKGPSPAMYLERMLYTCPKCHSRNTMHSKNDIFYCAQCQNSVKYNKYGFFEAVNEDTSYFKTITEWDHWQKNYMLGEYTKNTLFKKDTPLYADKNIRLYSCLYLKKNELLQTGDIKLFSDRIEIISPQKNKVFYINDIIEMQAILGQILQFSTQGGEYYEIKSSSVFSALKYVHIMNLIKNGSGPDGLFSI